MKAIITKSSSSIFISIVLIIAFIDYQSWLLEQLLEYTSIQPQLIFTLEALIIAALTIFIYKQVKTFVNNLSLKENNLSERELEVLENILSGKSNRAIEESLFIEKSTLKSHINRIYKKLNVQNRDELISRYSSS